LPSLNIPAEEIRVHLGGWHGLHIVLRSDGRHAAAPDDDPTFHVACRSRALGLTAFEEVDRVKAARRNFQKATAARRKGQPDPPYRGAKMTSTDDARAMLERLATPRATGDAPHSTKTR
jgi:hypothetical protein